MYIFNGSYILYRSNTLFTFLVLQVTHCHHIMIIIFVKLSTRLSITLTKCGIHHVIQYFIDQFLWYHRSNGMLADKGYTHIADNIIPCVIIHSPENTTVFITTEIVGFFSIPCAIAKQLYLHNYNYMITRLSV